MTLAISISNGILACLVSYLFRSLGGVLGISVGSTLVQNTLRSYLRRRLAGQDVDIDDVRWLFFPSGLKTYVSFTFVAGPPGPRVARGS